MGWFVFVPRAQSDVRLRAKRQDPSTTGNAGKYVVLLARQPGQRRQGCRPRVASVELRGHTA
jgi:hypothetical protein